MANNGDGSEPAAKKPRLTSEQVFTELIEQRLCKLEKAVSDLQQQDGTLEVQMSEPYQQLPDLSS